MNAEALTLAQKFGLDLETTLDVLNSTTATNGQLKVNWANKVLAGDIAPGFTIDLAHKDISLVTASAQTERVAMPLAAMTREMFNMARAGGYAQADFSGILDFNCDLAKVIKPRLKTAS
jgi:4-hydroxybutyrate dehydrogenase/sulfolactaldehyde 3-reductase